jgi:hypothetical protein
VGRGSLALCDVIAFLRSVQVPLQEANSNTLMHGMQIRTQNNNGNRQSWLMSNDFSNQLGVNLECTGASCPTHDTPLLKK